MLLNFINQYLNLFIISFLFNFIIFYIIKSGLFGDNLKFKLNQILKSNINLITFISFFLFLLVSIYLNMYKLHLDNTVVVIKTVINDSQIVITGSLLMNLMQSIGSAGIFAASYRIVAGLLAKQHMSTLTKYGYITGGEIGTTVIYRMASNSVPLQSTLNTIIKTGPIQVTLENSSNNNNLSNLINSVNEQNTSTSLLEHCKKFTMNNTQLTENTEKLNNGISQITINGNTGASSKILNELEKLDLNWKDKFFVKSPLENGDAINNFIIENFFIKSPLEKGDPMTKFFIDTLTDHVILHFIILYFILGLTIIIICKINLPKDPQFPKVKSLPFGNLIHKLLTYYITMWQISSNFWIYFILFFIFLFNLGSLISITKLLIYFQSL
jgi:hypothetical protein